MVRNDPKRANTRNVTIMFTDIKGFTARVSEGSRDDLAKLRDAHDRLLLPVFKHFNGNVVKTIGDAFLVRFDSPTDAVLCGVTIQEVLRQHNAFVEDEKEKFYVRVAINTGDVDVSENDVMGEPVNIAARVEAIAEPGEVFFTEAVYLSMNRKEAPCAEVGEHTFKGIPYPVRVYKVSAPPDSDLTRRVNDGVRLTATGPVIKGLDPSTSPPLARRVWPIAAVALVGIIVVAVVFSMLPSAADRAKSDATAAIAANNGAGALSTLDAVLSNSPDHPELKALAIDAAKLHIDHLRETVGYAKASAWLREQLQSKSYLDPLRKRAAVLEAEELASTFLDTNNDPLPPLRELANQDLDDYEIPLAAARILEGKVFPAGPLNLYEMAMDRGYLDEDGRVFRYCIRLFAHHHPTAGVRAAHEILKKHLREQGLAWAQDAFANSDSGIIMRNAQHILVDHDDPLLKDPWHAAVYNSLTGFDDETLADETLALFKTLKDEQAQKRLVALHRWLLDPPKGVGWGYRHKDLIQRNLEALETEWNLKPDNAEPK